METLPKLETVSGCCSALGGLLSPQVFKALGEPNRVAILTHLAQAAREMTVSDVASCCPVNLSVVSRHLKTLRDAGILEAERRGKEVYYRVRISEVCQLLRGLADALEACCPDGYCPPATIPEE